MPLYSHLSCWIEKPYNAALPAGMEKLESRVVEMLSGSFTQKVSKDHADHEDTNDGSWLCAVNNVDYIAAKIHNQHYNR